MTINVTYAGYKADPTGKKLSTAALLKAADMVRKNAWPLPNDAATNGVHVYLPAGTYRIDQPIPLHGYGLWRGDGPDTVIDATALPPDRAVFEIAPREIGAGAWWCGGASIRDMKIVSGGHAIADLSGKKPTVLSMRVKRLELTCRGWGVYLPDAYTQDMGLDDVTHLNPCAGGLCLAGNKNVVKRYAMVRGWGGWDGRQGFRSPWLDGRGSIDIGGQQNLVEMCHVEHGLPLRPDGTVDPRDAVVPFRFWSTDPGTWGGWQDVIVNGLWPEFQQPGAVVGDRHVRCERVEMHGYWGTGQGVRVDEVPAWAERYKATAAALPVVEVPPVVVNG